MITLRRRVLAAVAFPLAAAAIAPAAIAGAPHAAAAKSYKVDYTVAKGPVPKDLAHQTGKLTGTPFGPATFTGKTVVPVTTYVWKFKGGNLHITFNGALKGVIASGPWKVTGGTGRFAHATGKGQASGGIDGSKQFHFTGTVKL